MDIVVEPLGDVFLFLVTLSIAAVYSLLLLRGQAARS